MGISRASSTPTVATAAMSGVRTLSTNRCGTRWRRQNAPSGTEATFRRESPPLCVQAPETSRDSQEAGMDDGEQCLRRAEVGLARPSET